MLINGVNVNTPDYDNRTGLSVPPFLWKNLLIASPSSLLSGPHLAHTFKISCYMHRYREM